MTTRMRLRRADGQIYLDRWGIERRPWFGIYLHRMRAPDPGVDLHDHPWPFGSLVLWGGYTEERARTREAPMLAEIAEVFTNCTRGDTEHRGWLSVRRLRLDECHRIIALDRRTVWTLVFHGRWHRLWGFYTPQGWVESHRYGVTVRADRRDMWNEVG